MLINHRKIIKIDTHLKRRSKLQTRVMCKVVNKRNKARKLEMMETPIGDSTIAI